MMEHVSGDKAKDYSQGEVCIRKRLLLSPMFFFLIDSKVLCIYYPTPGFHLLFAGIWDTERTWIHRGHGIQILS